MARFLHTADWQIGRQYARFASEDGAALSEARFSAVERIAALAATEQVDAVLVAGDVFDAQTVSDRSLRRVFNATAAYSGPWLLLPGNHDAALAESVWTRAQRLGAVPDNVHLLLSAEVVEFAAVGFAVLPAPLSQRHTAHDLTAWFDEASTTDGLLRIGLAHGSVQGVLDDDIDAPNPIDPTRVERARLDYLALGDWHGTRRINARCWYSGTPEQERFKDNDPGNVLLVDIAGSGAEPVVEVRALGQHRWLRVADELALAADVERLVETLAALPARAVVDLQLGGTIDLGARRQLEQALAEAEGRLRSLQADLSALRLQPTEDDLAALQADGYVGAVIAELRQQQEGADAEVAGDALAILAGLLDQRPQDGGSGQ